MTERGGESTAAPRVGGAKGKKKAASKAAKKGKKGASEVKTSVEKIVSYTPGKGKKETPQKGKVSAKKTISAKKGTPAMPSPGGKKSTKTTD